MNQERGFGTLSNPTTPGGVKLDAQGWPLEDFGVMFFAWVADPLNRPQTQTYPSFYGTYSLSFTGKKRVRSPSRETWR